jgi:ubiquinone/menaquinone biosynthesis C-methylase UbiE
VEKTIHSVRTIFVLAFCFLFLGANAQKLQMIPGHCGIYYKNMADLYHQKKEEIGFYSLQPGEKVASIGAQCGHWEAVLAAASENVQFYLEDIDSTYFNERQVGFAWHYYDSLRGRPLTSGYTLILGTESSTRLPENSFDKILIINSLHEFSKKEEMLEDIHSKLKAGGALFIDEPLPRKSGQLHGGCHKPMITESEMTALLTRTGFTFLKGLSLQYLKKHPTRRIYCFIRS